MTSEDVEDSGAAAIALAAVLDYPAAADLAGVLLEHRREAVRLDASGVRHLGALCLQVLLSAAGTWRVDAISFSVEDPSPGFSEDLARMGVAASELSGNGGRT